MEHIKDNRMFEILYDLLIMSLKENRKEKSNGSRNSKEDRIIY